MFPFSYMDSTMLGHVMNLARKMPFKKIQRQGFGAQKIEICEEYTFKFLTWYL